MAGPGAVTQTNDAELITAARNGDTSAFGELVQRYRDDVVNVVYRITGDPDLAEEATQEAFVRAWRKLDRYRNDGSFRSWIYRIAINASLDQLRRKKVSVGVDLSMLADKRDGPETEFIKVERARRVQEAVLGLPENSRSVLVLREYEGLSYREIAETIVIPMGTVMSRLNYARQHLRRSLAPYLEAE